MKISTIRISCIWLTLIMIISFIGIPVPLQAADGRPLNIAESDYSTIKTAAYDAAVNNPAGEKVLVYGKGAAGGNAAAQPSGFALDAAEEAYDVPLVLSPPDLGVILRGEVFSVDILTSAADTQPIDGVDVYIYFDTALLSVLDADTAEEGTQITPGGSLPEVLRNEVDSEQGLITFSAGKLAEPFPSGCFKVATIQFAAQNVQTSGATSIFISVGGDHRSFVDYQGYPVYGEHGDSELVISSGVNASIAVQLQGGLRPASGWSVPLSVKFFEPGTLTDGDILSADPLYSFESISVLSGGQAVATVGEILPGIYDISLDAPHCLTAFKQSVIIEGDQTRVDMGILLEGNANNDQKISIKDFGLLLASYGALAGQPRYSAAADFDLNNEVNIADFQDTGAVEQSHFVHGEFRRNFPGDSS